ncbi:MAG: PqqD family protein [Thermoflexales bacterium]|nr:PqqD family protein [Thermoflexales bacterium]
MFDHTRIKRIDGAFLHRQIEGETFIAALDGSASFMLNPVGSLIWELADGQHSLAQIAAVVCDRCEVTPEVALRDVRELAEELVERGLVVET